MAKAQTPAETPDTETKQAVTGLALLREPFPANKILKLAKPYKKDSPKGKCPECGGWHGLPAVHLDYVGHAALTERLLDADPNWTWEPLAVGPDGYPVIDREGGGMWIKLTVCGVTRLGYGDAQGKTGGNAVKERIGDALRNAAMRFGAALNLWHKGEWADDIEEGHHTNPAAGKPEPRADSAPDARPGDNTMPANTLKDYLAAIASAESFEALQSALSSASTSAQKYADGVAYRQFVKARNIRHTELMPTPEDLGLPTDEEGGAME